MTNQRPSYLGGKSRSHFVNILDPVRLWLACSDSAFVDADFISCAGIRLKWIWISYARSVDEAGIAWAIASEAIAFEAGFAVEFIVTLLAANKNADAIDKLVSVFANALKPRAFVDTVFSYSIIVVSVVAAFVDVFALVAFQLLTDLAVTVVATEIIDANLSVMTSFGIIFAFVIVVVFF